MSFKIDFLGTKVIATFSKEVQEDEIKDAFLYVVENGNVKKLKHIIFDYTNTIEYAIPDNFLETVQVFTKFSQTWNTNINAIAVATNQNLRIVTNEIIKNSEKLNLLWNYMLFDDLTKALNWCKQNE